MNLDQQKLKNNQIIKWKQFRFIVIPRCPVPLLVGLSSFVDDDCLAKSEKLNLAALANTGLFAAPNENVGFVSAAAVVVAVNVAADPNENVGFVSAAVVVVDDPAGVENWNPAVGVAAVLPKPGKENPPLVLFDDFNAALLPNTEVLVLFNGVELPKIDEVPLTFAKIDGLLSYCDVVAFGVDDGDSTDIFSSFVVDVCFCNCDLSGFRNENLLFSLELNGVFGPVNSP